VYTKASARSGEGSPRLRSSTLDLTAIWPRCQFPLDVAELRGELIIVRIHVDNVAELRGELIIVRIHVDITPVRITLDGSRTTRSSVDESSGSVAASPHRVFEQGGPTR